MNNELARQIITEFVFGDYKIESIDKFVNKSITDKMERKLLAESMLTQALQKAVVALGKLEN